MAKKDKKALVQGKDSSSSEIAKKFKQRPLLYIGSVVILVLIIITFIGGDFISGGGFGGQGGDWVFGHYDKIPIEWIPGNTFNIFYDNVKFRYQSQGFDVNNNRWIEYYLFKEAYDSLVIHTAVLQMLKKSKYTVPEKKVDREVAQHPRFLDSNGIFSKTLYRQMPESQRLNIWRQRQEELAKQMFFDDLFAIHVPKSEADFFARMALPMRGFEMVAFNVDDYPESESLAFALENPRLFSSMHVSRITGPSESETRRILASIKNGTVTFEEAARNQQHDQYADRGGNIGVRYFFEFEQEIPNSADREKLYSLRRGELSEVISTVNGWAFYRIEGDIVQADFEDEIIMDRVRSYIGSFERGRMEDWAIEQAREFNTVVNEFGFAEAAYIRNMERQNIEPFPVNYGSVDLFKALAIPGAFGQDVSELARNENFWKTAFSTELNTPCEPVVQGSYVYVFFPVEQIEEDEFSLDSIASNYSDFWLESETWRMIPSYFLKHEKMKDNFEETYSRIFSE
ncbi:MAG: SurA N-terminal domain-containing protein [Treponema sp.]|nr:SurA N-terminal domain-containing protein [Treponema sp.]